MARFLVALALLHAGLLPCATGKADGTTDKRAASAEPAEYRSAINSAIGEFDQGNFEEAREHFARAHGLLPSARTLRGLGMSEFELRNYIEAVRNLSEALASEQKPLPRELREETRALLKRAQKYVGHVVVQLKPSSASVRADGIPLELGDARQIPLEVGDHVLEFVAGGYLSERRAIKVRGEQSTTITVSLVPAQLAGAPPGPGDSAASDARDGTPIYKRWWLWTSVGAVVVGGIVAGVLIASRSKDAGDPHGGTTGDVFVVK